MAMVGALQGSEVKRSMQILPLHDCVYYLKARYSIVYCFENSIRNH